MAISRQRVLLRDLRLTLVQQLFFWGRDVLRGDNLLLEYGFKKRPSAGLQGTSCYWMEYGGGLIELHGACVGWYPQGGREAPGFLFVRNTGRCTAHWLSEPVIPGRYRPEVFCSDTPLIVAGARVFAAWLAGYEEWILKGQGAGYRRECRAMLSRLPKGRPWLPAERAVEWLQQFADRGAQCQRARCFFQSQSIHSTSSLPS